MFKGYKIIKIYNTVIDFTYYKVIFNLIACALVAKIQRETESEKEREKNQERFSNCT